MSNAISDIVQEGLTALTDTVDLVALDNVKARYLGKEGAITSFLKGLAALSPEEKRSQGAEVNRAKQTFEQALQARRDALLASKLEQQLASEALDVTLPGRAHRVGGLHPVTLVRERVVTLFQSIGFSVVNGPEVEDDWHNFTALNMPKDHPARAMQDTFYVRAEDGQDNCVLRTHTSPIQIRHLLQNPPPLKVVAPGRVYRVDSDATHSPMFHQMEGLWVDKNVSFSDLKATLVDFLRQFFERDDLQVRFRPSFFPFTEPSAEVDVLGKHGWMEVLGCGLVHPNVLRNVGLDPEVYSGFAFGMGLDRFAMLYYGVNDLRLFFENDISFLDQFF